LSEPDRQSPLVVVRGGGDLATGAARRLFLSGYRVVVTERPDPWCVRRTTCFARAVVDGELEVEGVRARRAELSELGAWSWDRIVAVVVCPGLPALGADLLVDGRVLKHGHDTRIDDAPLVIGLGPGFEVGRDCHAAVETARGHDLGRVLLAGATRPFDGRPGAVGGAREARVLRAPLAGVFVSSGSIGDLVDEGTTIGTVSDQPVRARLTGVIRGLLADGVRVRANQKLGDLDPRNDPALCRHLSDKANAVGGGVVEAAAVLLGRRDAQG